MMNRIIRRNCNAGIALLCGFVLLCAGSAVAASVGARLTAVVGEATSGDAALSREGALAEDTQIKTGSDGGAAMLVDEDSLVELCAETIMTLTRNEAGNRVIEVGAGTTRIIVQPRPGEEHIQIHTPAAIATILGTVVYVTVDPITRESSIATLDNPVRIISADPTIEGSTTIHGSERITMMPGEAPAAVPERLPESTLTNLGGCLADFHAAALQLDRIAHASNVGERIALLDGRVASLPRVAIEKSKPDPPTPGSRPSIEDPSEVLSPIDTVNPPQQPDYDDFDYGDYDLYGGNYGYEP
ncbi:MAG: FecR domain-containing protein [Deltaproteobacteria bacterium]|nr:FecR domain-containing protein [Deltaproteobacteria bacterium]